MHRHRFAIRLLTCALLVPCTWSAAAETVVGVNSWVEWKIASKSRLLAVLESTGDLAEMLSALDRTRQLSAKVAARDDEQAGKRIAVALQPLFLEPALRMQLAHGFDTWIVLPEQLDAVEAWAAAPGTSRVNAAMRQPEAPKAAPVSPERLAKLKRLASSMKLYNRFAGIVRTTLETLASVADATDSSQSKGFDVRNNFGLPGVPSNDELAESVLAPRLAGVSDEDLDAYLSFAESDAGNRWFAGVQTSTTSLMRNLQQPIAATASRFVSAPLQPPQGASAESLLADARKLLHERAVRTVVSDAVRALRQADAMKPNDAAILTELGYAAGITRNVPPLPPNEIRERVPPAALQPAADYLDRAIAADPTFSDAHVYRGWIHFLAFEDEQARASNRRARELGSRNPFLAVTEADLLIGQGKLTEGLAAYEQAMASADASWSSVNPVVFKRVMRVATKMSRPDEIERVGDALLQRSKEEWDVRHDYARHLLETGREPGKAVALLEPVPKSWNPQVQDFLQSSALAMASVQPDGSIRDAAMFKRAVDTAGSDAQLVVNVGQFRGATPATVALVKRGKSPAELATKAIGLRVAYSDVDGTRQLLALGADPNTTDPAVGERLLASAALARNVELFGVLLEGGADPDFQMSGGTLREFLVWRDDEPRKQMLAILDAAAKR